MFVFQLDPTQFLFLPGMELRREAGSPLYQLSTCCSSTCACQEKVPEQTGPPHPTPPAEADCGLAKNQITMRCLSDF